MRIGSKIRITSYDFDTYMVGRPVTVTGIREDVIETQYHNNYFYNRYILRPSEGDKYEVIRD